ncbi:MAG: hypothetical protein HC831_22345 [Chloroflexia bacterium]|nr:hypothetical protein [Chloroflexia bacterium]
MKRILLFMVLIIFSLDLKAQFSPGTSGNTYYNLGNVGIGTTNPTNKLEVKDGSIYLHGPETGMVD